MNEVKSIEQKLSDYLRETAKSVFFLNAVVVKRDKLFEAAVLIDCQAAEIERLHALVQAKRAL